MKVIFLDFDGVLNSWDDVHDDANRSVGIIPLYERPVSLVWALCRDTGARVVVSSSWRLIHNIYELRGYLGAKGFPREWVLDVTPNQTVSTDSGLWIPYGSRGDEIQAWLDAHPDVTGYVILDDDGLGEHGHAHPIADRHIKTEFAWGLRQEHVERAMALLTA